MSDSIAALKKITVASGLDTVDVDVLLCHVLQKPRTYLFTWPEKKLSTQQAREFKQLCEQRRAGQPIAYLVGEREFWSLPLKTHASTLIPRPDTEVLVEAVLDRFDSSPCSCVDLGTGTGAIALALKSERPAWRVKGLDRIDSAVDLASTNASRLSLDVEFQVSDWCDVLSEDSVDILVSNPPYIDADDPHLAEGDVRFEPRSALVADDQGLADIRTIALQGGQYLKEGGALFLEHGWQQAEAVRTVLESSGYANIATLKDYGGNDRVSFGYLRK